MNGKRFSAILLILLFAAAYTDVKQPQPPPDNNEGQAASRSDTTEPPPLPTATPVPWQPDPEALVLLLWRPHRTPGIYAGWNVIPQLQIWGDGRMIWTALDSHRAGRQVNEGYVSNSDMTLLYQHLLASSFETWAERYDQGAEPLPGTYLAVDLAMTAFHPRRVYVEGETPEQFRPLFDFLAALPANAQNPHAFLPPVSELHVHSPVLPVTPNYDGYKLPEWPTDAPPLTENTQFSVTGEPLLLAWDLVNRAVNAPRQVQQGEMVYTISLAVPGLSFCRAQASAVMYFCP